MTAFLLNRDQHHSATSSTETGEHVDWGFGLFCFEQTM